MTKRTAPQRPGNDGDWFIELVTKSAAPPQAPLQPATPPSATGPAVAPEDSTAIGVPPAAASPEARDAAQQPLPAVTGTTRTVERMWQDKSVDPIPTGVPTSTSEPFADWTPEELSRTIRSRRNYRWSVLAALIVLGGLMAVVLVWIPTISERAASERTAEYSDALVEVRRRLPDAQQVLGSVTDLTLDIPADAAATLAGLTSAAQNAGNLAAEELPSTFPLIPRSPIEELQPHREQLGLVAGDASSLGSRLDAIYRYRAATEDLVALPPLPTEAGAASTNELSVSLATLLADATGALSGLPADEAMDTHRNRLGDIVERLGEWQVEYLDALRREDTTAAAALVEEAAFWQERLDSAMAAGMGAARSELDTELVRLASAIERALAGLPT